MATRATTMSINREAKKLGFEIVKGKGYFYWAPLNLYTGPQLYNSMVMVTTLSQMPNVDEWIDDLKYKIEESK